MKYATFDTKLADLATDIKGDGGFAKITFAVGKFGNKITNLEAVAAEA